VRDTVADTRLSIDVDAAALAASELVSNAVRHAGTSIKLRVVAGRRLRVEVTDSRPELPVAPRRGPRVLPGRGLTLVDALASRWGHTRGRRTKTVWFELDPTERSRHDRHRLKVPDGALPSSP
jgi:two-component sensor histidine kinase